MYTCNVATPEMQKKVETLLGGYNDPLPNMKEITAEEFAQSSFFSYFPNFIGSRQIAANRLPEELKQKSYLGVTFYVTQHDWSGFAMSRDYWGKKVRYFSFAPCKHTYRGPIPEDYTNNKGMPRPGRCYSVSVCTKCGYILTVDSSD